MNDWITILKEDIEDFLLPSQLAMLTSRMTQAEPTLLTTMIGDMVGRVRADIGATRTNQLSEEQDRIPAELRPQVCYLVIEALQSRIPCFQLSADQVRNAQNARARMEQIARGEIPVSRPQKIGQNPFHGNEISMTCLQAREKRMSGNRLAGL